MTTKVGEMCFMYEVVEVWGDVPEAISSMVGDPGKHLMYPENRGIRSSQEFMRKYKHAGGWAMERRGAGVVAKTTRSTATSLRKSSSPSSMIGTRASTCRPPASMTSSSTTRRRCGSATPAAGATAP